MKKQKALNRLAAVAAVLLTLCLVFVAPVSAEDKQFSSEDFIDGYYTIDVTGITQDTTYTLTGDATGRIVINGGSNPTTGVNIKITSSNNAVLNGGIVIVPATNDDKQYFSVTVTGMEFHMDKSMNVMEGNYRAPITDIEISANKDAIKSTGVFGIHVAERDGAGPFIKLIITDNKFKFDSDIIDGDNKYRSCILLVNNGGLLMGSTFTGNQATGVTGPAFCFAGVSTQNPLNDPEDSSITISNNKIELIPIENWWDPGKTETSAIKSYCHNGGGPYTVPYIIENNEITVSENSNWEIPVLRFCDIPNEEGKLSQLSITLRDNSITEGHPIYLIESNAGTFTKDDFSNFVVENAVAEVDNVKYYSLADAVKAAEADDTVTLLKDIEDLQDTIKIERKLTITGGESQKSITTSQRKIFEVYADATFKNLNLVNTNSDGRCIDTRKPAITVNIDNCNLIAKSPSSYWTQPLTIGGSGKDDSGNEAANIVVNLNKVNIEAKHYGIITYNPVDLTITDSSITGYAALYFKGPDSSVGSSGSTVKINGESIIKGINSASTDPSNAFGTFVFRSGGVEVILDNADVAHAISEKGTPEWIFDFCKSTGNTVTINSGVHLTATGGSDYFVRPYNDDSEDTQNTVTINSGVTSAFPIDSKYFANKELVCLGPVDGKYTVTAKTYKLTATEEVGFDSVKVGYTQPEPQTVTVTNNCNVPVKLEQPSSTNYVIGTLSATELAPQGTATFTIQPVAGLAVGNYADSITVKTNTSATADIEVSFLVYQPSSGGSSKPVEEPEEPVEPEVPVEPETPTEEPEAGEATVETEVTDGGEVELETPTAGGSAAADEDETKITGVVLPTGTDSEVTFVPVSEQAAPAGKETQTKKVFEINVPNYEKGKPATIKFTMTVAELEADGKEAADVALWHFDEENGEWTKLVTSYTIVDGVVYFEAITNDFSPFAIVYEDEPVDEPVDEPETPASPAPVLGLIAALGAAVALRRK